MPPKKDTKGGAKDKGGKDKSGGSEEKGKNSLNRSILSEMNIL